MQLFYTVQKFYVNDKLNNIPRTVFFYFMKKESITPAYDMLHTDQFLIKANQKQQKAA